MIHLPQGFPAHLPMKDPHGVEHTSSLLVAVGGRRLLAVTDAQRRHYASMYEFNLSLNDPETSTILRYGTFDVPCVLTDR